MKKISDELFLKAVKIVKVAKEDDVVTSLWCRVLCDCTQEQFSKTNINEILVGLEKILNNLDYGQARFQAARTTLKLSKVVGIEQGLYDDALLTIYMFTNDLYGIGETARKYVKEFPPTQPLAG